MRKLVSLLLATLFMLALSGCGMDKAADIINLPTVEEEIQPSPLPLPSDPEQQKLLIEAQRAAWAMSDDVSPWFYTVTDLDRNGRLEVISAATLGTGHFTHGKCWEVSEDYLSLNECPDNLSEGMFWPELIVESAACYHDSQNQRYYYIFQDNFKADASTYYSTVMAMELKDGMLNFEALCSKAEVYTPTSSHAEFYDSFGSAMEEDEYEIYPAIHYAGCGMKMIDFSWQQGG